MMPMIDMVFLLLIFFLLTSIVAHEDVLDISLPKATRSEAPAEDGVLQIVIRKGGQVELEHLPVSLEDMADILKSELHSEAAGGRRRKLLLRADREVSFGRFVQVLDRLQGLDVDDLAILTETPEHSP